ncbi:kinase-like domain-containing protein [Thamnidium elegans]|nr:kinase-like domain-containing protein [Thamnidium elegans]
MENRTNTHRLRINATLRMGTQKQATPTNEQNIRKPLDKLEVTIPRSLQPQLSPKVDSLLRPLQTNSKERSRKPLKPLQPHRNVESVPVHAPDPVKKSTRSKKEYKLVEDKDIPAVLIDNRHKVTYTKAGFLGVGAFAKVYRIKTQDETLFAAKIVSKLSLKPEKIKKKLFAEINIHRVLKHDYIVKFHSCFEDKLNIYLVLELCKNGTLSNMLRARKVLTEDEVRFYMGQILSALRYMSDNRILHRDLKLGNVLLDENMDCKLGDFGLAALLLNKEDRRRTICGTPHYIAPEILFNKEGHNHRADMWSAGVLMYNLLFGKHPFHHDEPGKLYEQVRQNEMNVEYSFPTKYTGYRPVSDNAKDLIRKLLVNNPDDRLSVIGALEHSFFSDFKMPLHIPKTALYKIPEHHELFGDDLISMSSQSKVEDAIRKAKDKNESHVDNRINPPLNIMSEIIVDPRSQYPINTNSQPSNPQVIPVHYVSVAHTKKRSNVIQNNASKRVCSVQDMKANMAEPNKAEKPIHVDLPKVETLKVTRKLDYDTRPFAVPLPLPTRKPIMEEMADNLKVMIDRGAALPASRRTEYAKKDDDFEWYSGNIFVQNWMDCTECYGFLYRLSDGTMGVLYNDMSTMTSMNFESFYYIYQNEKDMRYIESNYDLRTIPVELKKKQELLNSFKKYAVDFLPLEFSVPQGTETTKIHLFKYIVCETCITFRLNNGVIQFNFFKSDKLILYEKGKKLIYIDKRRKMHHCNTIDALKSNEKEIINALNKGYAVLKDQNVKRESALRDIRWQRMSKDYSAATI